MIISTNNFSYMQRFYGIVVPKLLVLATRKSLPNAPATFIIAVLIGKLAIPYKCPLDAVSTGYLRPS